MKKFLLIVTIAAALAGCNGSVGPASTVPNLTPAARVDAALLDFNTVLVVVGAYEAKPRCATGQSAVSLTCSDTKIVGIIRNAMTTALNLIKEAEVVVHTPGIDNNRAAAAVAVAEGAVSLLRKTLEQYGVKTNG